MRYNTLLNDHDHNNNLVVASILHTYFHAQIPLTLAPIVLIPLLLHYSFKVGGPSGLRKTNVRSNSLAHRT
ncbi:hypothetical protein PTB13_23575, partial [Bacillus sp. MHSD17]|nr:hypothetical protein [Bacillus sp. MHSD17]